MTGERKAARASEKERKAAEALAEAQKIAAASATQSHEAMRERNLAFAVMLIRFGSPLAIPMTDMSRAAQLVECIETAKLEVPLAEVAHPLVRLWLRLIGRKGREAMVPAVVVRWKP